MMKKRLLTLLAVLCLLMTLAVPAYAAGNTYIYESAMLLTDAEIMELNQMCTDAAEAYGCGIYVVTLDDHSMYHSESLYAAEEIYRAMDFGVGENKNGILLMLSMSQRDYALVAYGDIANSVFTDRRQDAIIDDFLDDFANDDWEGGLGDYVENCVYTLENFDGVIGEAYSGYYEDGVYYPVTLSAVYAANLRGCMEIGLMIGAVVALIWCIVKVMQTRTVRVGRTADEYVPVRGVNVHLREDTYVHSTHRTVVHSDDDDDGGSFGGGTSVRSSGFSGSSGKF